MARSALGSADGFRLRGELGKLVSPALPSLIEIGIVRTSFGKISVACFNVAGVGLAVVARRG